MGAAIAAAIAGAAVSAGAAYAMQPGQPTYPNAATSSAELVNANAKALPTQLQEEAASQLGENIQVPNTGSTTKNVVSVVVPGVGTVPYVPSEWQQGGKYYEPGRPMPSIAGIKGAFGPRIIQSQVTVQNTGTKPTNFAGYGTAQIQAAQAAQTAQEQLALAQQFDPQFIAQAAQEENLANPQGVQARTEENKLIQQEVANPQTNPVANQLNAQIAQQISAASANQMTPQEEAQFAGNVNEALSSRGSGTGSAAAFEQPIVTGASGLQRQQAAASAGTGWLSGGGTPADFAYRQQQQGMSDLSSLVNGATPESQFKELSGAQNGPTPNGTNPNLSQLPNQPNAAQQAAIQSTNTQMSSALQQVNPWSLGLSNALNLGTAIAKISGAA